MPRDHHTFLASKAICLLLLLFASMSAVAETNGERLRHFVHEMVNAMSAQDRPAAMRRVLADHSEIATWLAEGRDFRQLMKEADLPTEGLAMDIVELARGNFDVMLQAQLEKMGAIGSGAHRLLGVIPGVKRALDVIPRASAKIVAAALASPPGKRVLLTYAGLGRDQRLALTQLIPSASLDAAAKQIDRMLTDIKPEDIPAMKTLLGVTFKIPELSEKGNERLKKNVIGYFRIMPLEEKKRVLLAVLQLPPHSPLENQLSAAVLATGPVFGKLLQLVRPHASSEEVQKAAALAYDSMRPFPTEAAVKIIEKNLGQPLTEVFFEFNPEPIKTGTMAQVYSAVLRSTGQKVAIKVRRPGVLEQGLEEIARLYQLADGDPVMIDLTRKLEAAFRNECDFIHEAANSRRSQKVYTDFRKGIRVAGLTPHLPKAAFDDMLVQEWAPGQKLDLDITDPETLVKQGEAVSRLLRKFIKGALWKRYAHADLHPGNTLYVGWEQNWQQRVLAAIGLGVPNALTTVIDHGSAGGIPAKVRRGIVKMGFALFIRSSDDLLKAMKDMGVVVANEQQLKPALDRIMARPGLSVLDRMSEVAGVMQDAGSYLPFHLLLFNRARMFLESDLTEINKRLDESDPGHKYKRFDLQRIYMHAGVEGGVGQLVNLISRKNKAPVPITWGMAADFIRRGVATLARRSPADVSSLRCGYQELGAEDGGSAR